MTETYESLRARLLYVAGDGPALIRRIHEADDHQLDLIAEEYGIRRRTSERRRDTEPLFVPSLGWYAGDDGG